MTYLVVHRQPLVICKEMSIPIPLSHEVKTKAEALEFIMKRRAMSDDFRNATVMAVSKFRALNGWLPR